MPFQTNIKKIRQRNEWTQEDASKLLGVKKHNLGAWEEGRAVPKLEVLEKIITVYKVAKAKTYEFLFGDIDA